MKTGGFTPDFSVGYSQLERYVLSIPSGAVIDLDLNADADVVPADSAEDDDQGGREDYAMLDPDVEHQYEGSRSMPGINGQNVDRFGRMLIEDGVSGDGRE